MYSKGFFTKGEKAGVLQGFKQWLELQNYEPSTLKYGPQRIEEFIDWCHEHQIKSHHAKSFFAFLKTRENKSRPGSLSVSTLRIYLRTLRLFRRFLREVGGVNLEVNIIYRATDVTHHEILTPAEIKRLYKATEDDLLGIRDRAMLAIYYGCGLRRTEGASVLVDDILPDKNLLYVRKGKNYKERYVPILGDVRKNILTYLTVGRPGLLSGRNEAWFFIGVRGKKLGGPALYERLKKLLDKARIDKPCGLHSLRHSIATHLLANGMTLHQIAKLLGHSTLDTTQIYTHILKDLRHDQK